MKRNQTKPAKVRTDYHHRFYRYTRMMLRRHPWRAGHPMMLVAAMGNKSVRAIVARHLGSGWRQLYMDLCRPQTQHVFKAQGMGLALAGIKAELDRKVAAALNH